MSNRMLFAAVAAVASVVSSASAGKITIKGAEPGTTATIYVTGSGFSPFNTSAIVPAGGELTFTLDAVYQAGGNRIRKKYVPAGQAPASITVGYNFTEGTLPGLEPFTVATFLPMPVALPPADPTVEVDLNALLASGLTFNIGDTFNVNNGAVSGVPQVTIPGFTGNAIVAEYDTFAVLPEPTSMAAIGSMMLLARRRR